MTSTKAEPPPQILMPEDDSLRLTALDSFLGMLSRSLPSEVFRRPASELPDVELDMKPTPPPDEDDEGEGADAGEGSDVDPAGACMVGLRISARIPE